MNKPLIVFQSLIAIVYDRRSLNFPNEERAIEFIHDHWVVYDVEEFRSPVGFNLTGAPLKYPGPNPIPPKGPL